MTSPIAPERIGLFGGTFDPIHLGHLIVAQDALEQLGLDKIIFLPAKLSPHKQHALPVVAAADRLAMVRCAIAGEARFLVDDRELHREGVSYAIDTVRELELEHPNAQWIYLIGEDHVASLPTWKEYEILKSKVTFFVFPRKGKKVLQATTGNYSFLEARSIDISSTEIREHLARGASVRYFLPTPVLSYIEKFSLYT